MKRYTIVIKGDLNVSGIIEADDKDFVLAWLYQNNGDYEIYDSEVKKYFSIEEFRSEISEFVPKFYRMNPKTEDLLPNGRHLRNGMMVLVGDSKKRINNDHQLTDWELERAFHNNRWCTVGALEFYDGDVEVRFIGTYEDGSKLMRACTINTPWLVKKDSIREIEDKQAKVRGLVETAMIDFVGLMVNGSLSADETGRRAEQKAEDVANKIMRLF